jgi:hypothetical protein
MWIPALSASVLLLGCHLLAAGSPWGERPIERSAGDDDCADCHDDVATVHLDGPHGAANIACGQCHRGDGHPHFAAPLDDGTCGGCHLPEYQQVAASAHALRGIRATDSPQGLSSRFDVAVAGKRYFATAADASRDSRQLCVSCHFDGHRLSAAAARAPGFCETCHANLGNHPREAAAPPVDCLDCHMRRGVTNGGQPVTSHAFLPPQPSR